MSRLATCFSNLAARNQAAFVAYMMASDPDYETALEILRRLPAAGADIVELGFPFSDPVADGQAIQLSAMRALEAGGSLRQTLELATAFRKNDKTTPIVLMGYTNPVLSLGFAEFASAAAQAGVDGVIIVDLPPEEADPLLDLLEPYDIALIRLTTPTSHGERLHRIAGRATGFVYHVAVNGVTGGKEANSDQVGPAVAQLRKATGLPIAVGFGVRTPQRAAQIAKIADAVVVGSALVETITSALEQDQSATTAVMDRAQVLADAVRGARQ